MNTIADSQPSTATVVQRPVPYHEWRPRSFYTDECIHCGKRVTQGINDHGADAEVCPARQETKN